MVYSHTSYSIPDLARHISTDAGMHQYIYNPVGLHNGKQYNPTNNDDQKFTGHFLEQEGDIGIYHAQARMYDPAIGRFMGVDAMRSLYPGWSTYVYAMNNPVLLIDTTGNCAETSDEDEDSDVDCIEGYELDTVVITADRETGETRVGSISNIVSEFGFFEYSDSEGRARAAYDPTHPQGAQWLFNHFRENKSGCDNIANASMSGASHSIAITACIHGGQAVFLRDFLTYAGLGLGVAGGAITFGGIVVGSYGIILAGSALGSGASVLNASGHVMDGNYVGAGLEVSTLGISSTFTLVRNARNLTASEKFYLNSVIFKTQGIGQFSSQLSGSVR